MTSPLYIIGDLHGQIYQLEQALEWIHADGGDAAEIVFLGDLVDRGPDSKGVVTTLLDGQLSGKPWHVIKGNHDRMFTRFVRSGQVDDPRILSGVGWLHKRLGGIETLASYGVSEAGERPVDEVMEEAQNAVPAHHLEWLEALPSSLATEHLWCVHAGIVPGVDLSDQTEDDLLWIRDPFLMETAPHPKLVVHGHTAIDTPHHYGNRVNLDGGAGYGRPVYPAVFEGRSCWMLSEGGRIPLVP